LSRRNCLRALHTRRVVASDVPCCNRGLLISSSRLVRTTGGRSVE
jgi:hypothetical protein